MTFPPPGVMDGFSSEFVRTVFQSWFKKGHAASSKDARIAALRALFADHARVAATISGWAPELRAAVAEAHRARVLTVVAVRAAPGRRRAL